MPPKVSPQQIEEEKRLNPRRSLERILDELRQERWGRWIEGKRVIDFSQEMFVVEILQKTGWTYSELMNTPAEVVEEYLANLGAREMIRKERE